MLGVIRERKMTIFGTNGVRGAATAMGDSFHASWASGRHGRANDPSVGAKDGRF